MLPWCVRHEMMDGQRGSKPRGAGCLALVGRRFVADLYMRSLAAHLGMTVVAVHDQDALSQAVFAAHWAVHPKGSLAALLARLAPGHHVYSEKPLAMDLAQARARRMIRRRPRD